MKSYGLVGHPLSHSFSEKYFIKKFKRENIKDAVYELFPLENLKRLHELIVSKDLKGFTVTIPHKKAILDYIDSLDPVASEVGAVNTVKVNGSTHNGAKLYGYNTDVYGFQESLAPLLERHHQKALILGTGGASKAVEYVLAQMNIDYLRVSRQAADTAITYTEVTKSLLRERSIIINATPVGMFPKSAEQPAIPYEHLNSRHLLYDLIYNPEETEFLSEGKARKAKTKNGLEMLHLQADKAWEIWNKD